MASVVLDGGPADGRKLDLSEPLTSHYLVADTGLLSSGSCSDRHVYVRTSVIRPWPDQTWSWIYQYGGVW